MSSIRAYKEFAVPRSTIDYISQYMFNIPRMYQDCFKHYQLLYWKPCHLFSQIKDGTLVKDTISYRVLYLGYPAKLKHKNQLALSFRTPKDSFCISPIVLVKEG